LRFLAFFQIPINGPNLAVFNAISELARTSYFVMKNFESSLPAGFCVTSELKLINIRAKK